MKKDYPLLCNFCNTKEPVSKRKMYSISISEILLTDYEEYPHKQGDYRDLQICEDCFKNSDIKNQLDKENRGFK